MQRSALEKQPEKEIPDGRERQMTEDQEDRVWNECVGSARGWRVGSEI